MIRARRRRRTAAPDLASILNDLHGARAAITTAHLVMLQRDDPGPEVRVIGDGAAALDDIYEALDLAECRLSRLRGRGVR